MTVLIWIAAVAVFVIGFAALCVAVFILGGIRTQADDMRPSDWMALHLIETTQGTGRVKWHK